MSDRAQTDSTRTRVTSIDALRGFTMLWIIGGGRAGRDLAEVWDNPVTQMIRREMVHAKWDEGFTFLDLIMPTFLFVVGAVLPFAISRRLEQGQSRSKLCLHIVKRTLLLILMGLLINGLLRFDWSQMRWVGVLQTIGVCYFFAAMLVMCTSWRTQAIVAAAIIVSYWLAMTLIPVPGYGAGVITPQGCLPAYIDQLLLPGTFSQTYYGPGDSNGIMPILSFVSTTLLGVLAGHWLRSNRSGNQKASGLALAGLTSLAIGYLWGQFFPIVRLLCTSSMVLFAAGWSLLLLALFYWVMDVKGYKRWAFFFVVIGMNPITIYFLRYLVDFAKIARFFVQGIAEHAVTFQPIILPFSTLIVQWLFLWFLYRHRIFLKV